MDSAGFFGAEDVEFAKNGRYLLDIDGEGQKSYTRATTLAKTTESTFHLDVWKQKNAAKGVAMRPDLAARAAVTPIDDKPAWKEILEQAEVVAAGGAKANLGTAFHALHDNVATMADEEYAAVPADIRELYEKYRAELARLGIVEVISEVTVCATHIGTAGKADGFVRMPDGSIRVLDRKSGRVAEYPHGPAQQLAIYVNADRILMPSEGGPKWMDMSEAFPTLDKSTGLIVDVKYATATTPSSVHVYEIDLDAGWYGALLGTKVRRWRNRKDLLTPYQPEHMPPPKIGILSAVSVEAAAKQSEPEISGAGVPFPAVEPSGPTADLMPVAAAGVPAPSGHPAWSSAQQKVIQLNPDGTAAEPKKYGWTYAQIEAGEHLVENSSAQPEVAAADRQEVAKADQAQTGPQPILENGDADQLLKLFKDKAKLQAAARQLDPAMKVNRTRANLANDMVTHPQWAARRHEFIASQPVPPTEDTSWKPSPQQVAQAQAMVAAEQASKTEQQYPNAGLLATIADKVAEEMSSPQDNPFAQPDPAPVDPPSAPKSPEDLVLEKIAQAGGKGDLAAIWEQCQAERIPWTPRLQQAAQTKMSTF